MMNDDSTGNLRALPRRPLAIFIVHSRLDCP